MKTSHLTNQWSWHIYTLKSVFGFLSMQVSCIGEVFKLKYLRDVVEPFEAQKVKLALLSADHWRAHASAGRTRKKTRFQYILLRPYGFQLLTVHNNLVYIFNYKAFNFSFEKDVAKKSEDEHWFSWNFSTQLTKFTGTTATPLMFSCIWNWMSAKKI